MLYVLHIKWQMQHGGIDWLVGDWLFKYIVVIGSSTCLAIYCRAAELHMTWGGHFCGYAMAFVHCTAVISAMAFAM